MIDIPRKVGISANCLNIILSIHIQPVAKTANVIFPKIMNETRIPLFPFLFSVVLEFIDGDKGKGKLEGIEIGKEEIQLSLFAVDNSPIF